MDNNLFKIPSLPTESENDHIPLDKNNENMNELSLEKEKIFKIKGRVESFLNSLDELKKDLYLLKSKSKEIISEIDSVWISLIDAGDEFINDREELMSLSRNIQNKVNEVLLTMFDEGMTVPDIDHAQVSPDVIKNSADYKGDKTLVMIERINNPDIQNKLCRLLLLDNQCDLYAKKNMSDEDVKTKVADVIFSVSNDTPVTFVGEMPSANAMEGVRENMDILWEADEIFGENGVEQKNYIEAHEKGHTVRKIRSIAAYVYVGRGFNLENISIDDEQYIKLAQYYKKTNPEIVDLPTKEQVLDSIKNYLANPMELIERMSQLKNYFGMSGDEVFTKLHLQYAREHFISDTKLDNHMSEFFQSITEDTEGMFIKLINSLGV